MWYLSEKPKANEIKNLLEKFMIANATIEGKKVIYVPFGDMRYKENEDGYLELIADATFIDGKVTFSYNICDMYYSEQYGTDIIIADATINSAKEVECEIMRYYNNN